MIISSSYFLLCFFFFINFVFALSQPLWFYGFARLLQFIFLFLFFRHQGNKKGVYAPLLLGLLLGASIELYLSLSQLSQRHSMEGIWYFLGERSFSIFTPGIAKSYFADTQFLRPYGTFSHPNSLGGFYLLIYTVILTQKRITQQIFKRVFLIITSALILISFSRTAIAGYVLINLLYFSRTVFSCKLCSIAKIAVAFVLLLFIFNISGDPNSFQKRADFFGKSLSIIAQKPFSGTGIGSYLIAQHAFPQKFSTFFEQPVHNIFLLIVAQLGIPLSIMLFALIIQKIKHRVQSPALLLPLVCIILTGCVDHYWITLQQNVLVLAVIFGIILTSYEKKTT